MNQTRLSNERSGILWEIREREIFLCVRQCSKCCWFLTTYSKFPEEAIISVWPTIFRLEAQVLFRQVTSVVFIGRLSRERAGLAAIALCLCQAHTSASENKYTSMQDSTNRSLGQKIYIYIFLEWKGRVGKRTEVSQLRTNWRRDIWSRNLRPITSRNDKKSTFLCYCICIKTVWV
jgi:hypothetical protein